MLSISTTELLTVVRIDPSGWASSDGMGTKGYSNTLSTLKFFFIAKKRRRANRLRVPLSLTIWSALLDLFFLMKQSEAKFTIFDFVIPSQTVLDHPHTL